MKSKQKEFRGSSLLLQPSLKRSLSNMALWLSWGRVVQNSPMQRLNCVWSALISPSQDYYEQDGYSSWHNRGIAQSFGSNLRCFLSLFFWTFFFFSLFLPLKKSALGYNWHSFNLSFPTYTSICTFSELKFLAQASVKKDVTVNSFLIATSMEGTYCLQLSRFQIWVLLSCSHRKS